MPERLRQAALELGRQIAAATDCCALAWDGSDRPVLRGAAGSCDRVLGKSARALGGLPAGAIFGGGERAARDLVALCARGPQVAQRLLVRQAGPAPGRQFPAWLSLRPVPGGLVALVRDLTAQVPGADAALRAEDLARFSSLVAHEVRNPLSAVKIALQTLERGGRLQPNDGRRAAIAIREVRNIEQLLSDVQEFARPATLSLAPVDPLAAAGETVRRLAEEWLPRGVRFELELPLSMPLVQADPVRLRTALRLLGWQAAQAAEEEGGGAVIVGVRPRPRAALWELWVRDPARTLPKAQRVAAFVPFTPSRARGSGLGLAVVARIAQEHGGEVRFEPVRGGGNLVRLVLPT